MKEKKRKNIRTFYLSEESLEFIERKARESKISHSAYIEELIELATKAGTEPNITKEKLIKNIENARFLLESYEKTLKNLENQAKIREKDQKQKELKAVLMAKTMADDIKFNEDGTYEPIYLPRGTPKRKPSYQSGFTDSDN